MARKPPLPIVPDAEWGPEVSRLTAFYDRETGLIKAIRGNLKGKWRRLEIPEEWADRRHPRFARAANSGSAG